MKPRTRRALVYSTRIGAGLLALLIAASIVSALAKTAPALATADRSATARELTVFEAFAAPVQRQWIGYGEAEALRSADVPARVSATVINLRDDLLPGVRLKPGSPIVGLDPADFDQQATAATQAAAAAQASLEQIDAEAARLEDQLALAQNEVAIAQREYDRLARVEAQGSSTPADLDTAERALVGARRQVTSLEQAVEQVPARRAALTAERERQAANQRLAELARGYADITSPVAGILQSIDVEVGESVRAGDRVARVVDLTTIQVAIKLPASARNTLHPGDLLVLRPAAGNGPVVEATIDRIAPEDNAASRTLTVFALVQQPNANDDFGTPDAAALLVPGQYLAGRVYERRDTNALLVPRRSIEGDRLLVVRDGILQAVQVEPLFTLEGTRPETGLPDDQWAALPLDDDSPLRVGDQVVLNVATTAAVGDDVKPILTGGPIIMTPPTEPDGDTDGATPR